MTTNKTENECQSTLRQSLWLRFWWEVLSFMRAILVRVSTATTATLLAATTTLHGRRRFVGIVLICSGPLIEGLYLLFDKTAGDPLAYFNTYYFFFAVRADLSTILYATGFFLLMPEANKARFFALVPVTYKLARIIWMFFVTNNAQYHSFVPVHFLLYGGAAALILFFVFEWLMNLHFHKISGSWARVEGILLAPGIDNDTRVAIAQKELEILKQLK